MKASIRLLALLLALLAALGVFTTAVFAAEEATAAAGPEQTAGSDAAAAPEEEAPRYILREETVITEDETPLAAVPKQMDMFVERECCILHFVLMLAALAVAVYYTYDRKKHQQREFEVRSEL